MEKNTIAEAILKRLEDKKEIPFHEWVLEHIYLDGAKFSFEGHKYLENTYVDAHYNEVFMKAAQVGISTRMALKTFWLGDMMPSTALYYFPTDGDVEDFSNERIKKLILASPFLSQKIMGTDNVGLKQIGQSTVYFRGMKSKTRVKSVRGDYVILDELDESDQENVEFAKDRVMKSKLQWISMLSQPSVKNFGIHRAFQATDQRYFLLKCPACNNWCNVVESFPHCMIKLHNKSAYLGCTKCHAPLDTQAGEYVAKFPSRTKARGWQLSQLYTTVIPQGYDSPVQKFYDAWHSAKKKSEKKRIMISVVGVPYSGDDQPLTEETLIPALGTHKMKSRHSVSYMGVDVGDTMHAVVLHEAGDGKLVIHWLEEIHDDWSRLDKLMLDHEVEVCVIDAMPYKNSAKDFCRRHPGKAYIQYFKGDTLKVGSEGEGDRAVPKIHIDRTESLDDTVDYFKKGEIMIPDRSEYEVVEIFLDHLKMLIKDVKEDAAGNKKFVYRKNCPNHFGMAVNSARIASELAMCEVYASGLLPAGGRWN